MTMHSTYSGKTVKYLDPLLIYQNYALKADCTVVKLLRGLYLGFVFSFTFMVS